jgi:hypothetical protein
MVKSKFHQDTVRYLGVIILKKGLSLDEDKIETMLNWSREKKTVNGRLKNLFEVQ